MELLTVPLDVLTRYLGGEATREVIKRCTQGPVIAKKGSNGSFLFPLVHPQVVRHAEWLGISPHIEANAFLYLEEREGKLDYLVAVGEEHAIIGYGEFGIVSGRFHLVTAQSLTLWYTYETGGIRLTHLEDGVTGVAQAPPTIVEMNGEELERLVQKYAHKGVSEEEVIHRVAECTRELRKESAQLEQQNKDLEGRLGEVRAALANKEGRYAAREQQVKELEAALETAKAGGASKRELEELRRKYDRTEQILADERRARGELEGKLAEEKERYASLDATYKDFLARHKELPRLLDRLEEQAKEIHNLKEALAAAHPGAGKPAVLAYPPSITSQKDRFLYDLAKSLMRRCVAQKRYREDDQVGLGLDQKKLAYHPFDCHFSFYHLRTPQDVETIAATDNTSSTNEQRRASVAQFYGKQLEGYSEFRFPGRVYQLDKIPATAVLFFQLMKFGRGPLQSGLRIQEQLGFTQEQMKQAREQGLLRGTENGIERLSLNEMMRQVYSLFVKYRNELYQQCAKPSTSQSL